MNRRPETISPLSFIPLPPSNLRPFGAPPSIGRRDCPREPLPLEGAAERSEAGLASFLGDARVLSYNRALETISPLFFIPLPSIQPPPLRGTSFHRKEGVSTRTPSLGRGCRAQRGGVGFLFGGEAASSLPSPLGKGDRAAVDRVLSLMAYLRRISPLIFHIARTLSGSLRSPPSPRGEGCIRRYSFFHICVYSL